jgi:hypothetical protein
MVWLPVSYQPRFRPREPVKTQNERQRPKARPTPSPRAALSHRVHHQSLPPPPPPTPRLHRPPLPGAPGRRESTGASCWNAAGARRGVEALIGRASGDGLLLVLRFQVRRRAPLPQAGRRRREWRWPRRTGRGRVLVLARRCPGREAHGGAARREAPRRCVRFSVPPSRRLVGGGRILGSDP